MALSFDTSEPPAGLSAPLQALWWLKKGGLRTGPEWERAHAICQTAEGTSSYDRVHALAHWIEGDGPNSDYWYRRAGARREGADPSDEWQRQVAALGG
ncbi:MAG: hypothetical protein U1E59_04640 [Amaricoccus sp.]